MLIPAILTGSRLSAVLRRRPHHPRHRAGRRAAPTSLRGPLRRRLEPAPRRPPGGHQGRRGPAGRREAGRDRAIRDDALAGEYGDRVARAAERIQDRRARVFDHLPEDLQADLEELKALPDAEKVAAAQELRAGALAGEYGEQVQAFAERMQERRETCAGSAS